MVQSITNHLTIPNSFIVLLSYVRYLIFFFFCYLYAGGSIEAIYFDLLFLNYLLASYRNISINANPYCNVPGLPLI